MRGVVSKFIESLDEVERTLPYKYKFPPRIPIPEPEVPIPRRNLTSLLQRPYFKPEYRLSDTVEKQTIRYEYESSKSDIAFSIHPKWRIPNRDKEADVQLTPDSDWTTMRERYPKYYMVAMVKPVEEKKKVNANPRALDMKRLNDIDNEVANQAPFFPVMPLGNIDLYAF